jgi:uncharacterized protein (TIGR03792 family)
MEIEWLKFRVSPELREKFIQMEEELWTPMLRQCPGFLGKEIWINPEVPEEVAIVIRWQTYQDWKAVPKELIDATEAKFARSMGENSYQMLESLAYQLRKFPTISSVQ